LLAATSPRKLAGEIVNIAGGRRIGLNDLCREIGRLMGGDVKVDHVAPRAGDIRHSLADITRAHELLGYEPRVRWEEGLPATLAYMRALHKEGPKQASEHMTAARVGVEIPALRSGGAA
ncbi:MAG: hypothetical protein ABJE95_38295, partial [Byssovorax sp.]